MCGLSKSRAQDRPVVRALLAHIRGPSQRQLPVTRAAEPFAVLRKRVIPGLDLHSVSVGK